MLLGCRSRFLVDTLDQVKLKLANSICTHKNLGPSLAWALIRHTHGLGLEPAPPAKGDILHRTLLIILYSEGHRLSHGLRLVPWLSCLFPHQLINPTCTAVFQCHMLKL
jgi:hypothetical protein